MVAGWTEPHSKRVARTRDDGGAEVKIDVRDAILPDIGSDHRFRIPLGFNDGFNAKGP